MRAGRLVWFVAGSAAGVYASAKARRAAYRVSMPGLIDQASALGTGWRAFSAEVRDGMQARERDLARALDASHRSAFGELEAPTDHPVPHDTERDHP